MQERIKAFLDIAALLRVRSQGTGPEIETWARAMWERIEGHAAAMTAEQQPVPTDAREALARDLYERVYQKLDGGEPLVTFDERSDTVKRQWCTLVDVIGEIERERHPLRVLTVAPDGSQTVRVMPEGWRPLTEAEALWWRREEHAWCSRPATDKTLHSEMVARLLMRANCGETPADVRPRETPEEVEGQWRAWAVSVGAVTPEEAARATPLTVKECRDIAPTDAEEKAFRAGVMAERRSEYKPAPQSEATKRAILHEAQHGGLHAPSGGCTGVPVADLARAHLRPEHPRGTADEALDLAYGTWEPAGATPDPALTRHGDPHAGEWEAAACHPWHPKAGDRVRTVGPLKISVVAPHRKVDLAGEVLSYHANTRLWIVCHDDGTDAPYDESELRPEPAEEAAARIHRAFERVDAMLLAALLLTIESDEDRARTRDAMPKDESTAELVRFALWVGAGHNEQAREVGGRMVARLIDRKAGAS